jgi:hypothetical protein
MKKTLSLVLGVVLLSTPLLANAQTAPASDSTLIAALIQLVQTVQQEMTALETEVAQQQRQINNISASQPVLGATTISDVSTTPSTPTLTITLSTPTVSDITNTPQSVQPKVYTASVHIAWATNIPTNSKVFLTPTAQYTDGTITALPSLSPLGGDEIATTQVINSAAGLSTSHFIDATNLKINYQYSYIIEAISGNQDQKISGTFTTQFPQ